MRPMRAWRIMRATLLFVFFVSHASQQVRPRQLKKTTVMSIPGSEEEEG